MCPVIFDLTSSETSALASMDVKLWRSEWNERVAVSLAAPSSVRRVTLRPMFACSMIALNRAERPFLPLVETLAKLGNTSVASKAEGGLASK